MGSVYSINKGINTPVSFKGYKAQYIWYLGIGLVSLLVLFAAMYIAGMHPVFCLMVTLTLGGALFFYVGKLSRKYGVYGLQKKLAKKRLPQAVRIRSRKLFTQGLKLKNQ